jgi:hypothetical protein
MRRGFSASLLKRPNVVLRVSARLCDHRNSPDDYELSLRGKLINPAPYHSEGIELRARQHRWNSVELPITGK